MAQWDDIKYFFDEGIAYMTELVKSKNDITGTYNAGTDTPRFGWGIDGSRLGTISESAAALYNLIDALGAHPEIQTDLLPVFAGAQNWTLANRVYARFHQLARQLDGILGANAYIIANDERLSEHVQDILGYLLPQNVFMEQTTIDALGELAEIDVTGAAAGNFTDGAVIPIASFGNHNLVLMNTSGGNWVGNNTQFTIHVTEFDGTTNTENVVMPVGTADGATVDIGVHDADMYVDVTNITVNANGNAADKAEVWPEEERDVEANWWT